MTRNRTLVLDGLPPGAVLVAAAATTGTAILALLIGIAIPVLPRLLGLRLPGLLVLLILPAGIVLALIGVTLLGLIGVSHVESPCARFSARPFPRW
jgi:hypothetical protein